MVLSLQEFYLACQGLTLTENRLSMTLSENIQRPQLCLENFMLCKQEVCTENSIKLHCSAECLGPDRLEGVGSKFALFWAFLPAAWGRANFFSQVLFSSSWSFCLQMPPSLENREFHREHEKGKNYFKYSYFRFSFISFIFSLKLSPYLSLSFLPTMRICKFGVFILHLVLTIFL